MMPRGDRLSFMRYHDDLHVVLQEIVARWGIPGLAVGAVAGGEMVYAHGFGVQSLATRQPVTLDSVFCVQSVSKCFVATAVMQLAERGRIDLDAPLVRYLPYFQMDDARCRQITIRQMLSHTSGMPDLDESEYDELVVHPEWDEGAAERFVRGLRSRQLLAEPGERFSYSNIAYNVLGDMIAKVAGQPFEVYMREQVLIPSGMADSTFLVTDIAAERLAWPHVRTPALRVNPIYPYHRADAPASFLHSTVVDMCHWAITCLQRGNGLGQRILSPAGYDVMWTPAAARSSRPGLYESMGLGWNLGHVDGVKTASHGGAGFGGTAFLLLLPQQERAAIVLCNEESDAHSRVIWAVADALLDRKPQAGTVSWLVPISQALAEGGIQAAYARYEQLKAEEAEAYDFDAYDLDTLVIQLVSAKKIDLAIDVLGLNIHAHPEHVESYLARARLYRRKGEAAQAEENLRLARSIRQHR
jgi:CubicO group peptidase (beta-lactamase class C family)